jgi:hypothetical protein
MSLGKYISFDLAPGTKYKLASTPTCYYFLTPTLSMHRYKKNLFYFDVCFYLLSLVSMAFGNRLNHHNVSLLRSLVS